jgi:hypothetical protein
MYRWRIIIIIIIIIIDCCVSGMSCCVHIPHFPLDMPVWWWWQQRQISLYYIWSDAGAMIVCVLCTCISRAKAIKYSVIIFVIFILDTKIKMILRLCFPFYLKKKCLFSFDLNVVNSPALEDIIMFRQGEEYGFHKLYIYLYFIPDAFSILR